MNKQCHRSTSISTERHYYQVNALGVNTHTLCYIVGAGGLGH